MSPGFVPGAGHHHAEVSGVRFLLAMGLQASSLIYLLDVLAKYFIRCRLQRRALKLHASS